MVVRILSSRVTSQDSEAQTDTIERGCGAGGRMQDVIEGGLGLLVHLHVKKGECAIAGSFDDNEAVK